MEGTNKIVDIKEKLKDKKSDDLDKFSTEETKQIICFYLDNQEYGIEIEHVVELIRVSIITKLIHVPKFVKGLINLRGNITGVIDTKVFFNLPPIQEKLDTKIIVIEYKEKVVGLMVDKIAEIRVIKVKDINPVPPTVSKHQQSFLRGVVPLENAPLMILNIEEILFCQESCQFEANLPP